MKNSGEFNRKIKILYIPTVRDEYGSNVEGEPVELRETWSKVTQLSAFNVFSDSALITDDTFRFEIRYNPGFFPDKSHLIAYKNGVYGISEIIEPNDERDTVRITATKRS